MYTEAQQDPTIKPCEKVYTNCQQCSKLYKTRHENNPKPEKVKEHRQN